MIARRAGCARAASNPAMSARYSATLFVVVPMYSDTVGGSVDGSRTTAPIAAGPGFPREPPSKYTAIASRASSSAPSKSVTSRNQDRAAVVAVRDGARRCLAERVDLGGRDREVAALARVPDQARGADPRRRVLAAALVERDHRRVDCRGRGVAQSLLDRDLGVDLALGLRELRARGRQIGAALLPAGRER